MEKTMTEYFRNQQIDLVKYHVCRIAPETKLEADNMFQWLEDQGFDWTAVDIATDELIQENF